MKTAGIDLGTTNTVLASQGQVVRLRGADTCILPSVVAFPPNGEELVGELARERRPIDPKNTVYSAKRLMGETLRSARAEEFRRNYPFDLVDGAGGHVAFHTRAGDFTARDIATKVITSLVDRTDVERDLVHAVVTVPAAFTEGQRSVTRRALRNAGLREVQMVDEPIATAIAYLQRSKLKYAAVYDLGGGTFDLAILDCSTHPFRILAHGGDPYLGGDDIDRAIAGWLRERVLEGSGWDLGTAPEVLDRLVLAAETAKRRLTTAHDAVIELADVDPAAPTQLATLRLDRPRALSLASHLVRRTFVICDEVLGAAKLRASDVQAVFLAGGSTLLPGVKEHVQEYFGKRPRTDVPPMEAVAIGASLAATRPGLAGLLTDEETAV